MADDGRLMSEEYFDFICTNCDSNGKIVEAVRYCVECSGYCCKACTDQHGTFLVLKDHTLLDASQGNQASNQPRKLPEFPTERCDQHKGKVVDMYCEEHNEVGCYMCVSTNHKSCPEKSIYSVPDLIDKLYKLGECKQIQSRLTDMMVSLKTLGKSKDDLLEALKGQKNEVLEKVFNFQKALESMIQKAGETTRTAIENKYKELEKEVIQDMQDFEETENGLKESDEKLNKSEGNRAQRFVSSKIAEKKVAEANKLLNKPKVKANDEQFAFTPNQSLMKYLDGLQGIGMVGGNGRKKTDLYKISGSKDINIKLMDDSIQCCSFGCCLTFDKQLLVTDSNNHKLKLIDSNTMTVIDNCKLDSPSYGVCCISDHEAAVACGVSGTIQFVTYGKKMTPTGQIKTSHNCYGITTKDDKLYVTDNGASLYIYDLAGKLLKTISQDNAGNKLFDQSRHVTFNENGDKMYVGNLEKGVVCFDGEGRYQSTFNDTDLKNADGVCVDGSGNLFVVDFGSHNVLQFTEDGKKIGVVIKNQDGTQQPRSVCFHQELNRLFVTITKSDVVKMFDLH